MSQRSKGKSLAYLVSESLLLKVEGGSSGRP